MYTKQETSSSCYMMKDILVFAQTSQVKAIDSNFKLPTNYRVFLPSNK